MNCTHNNLWVVKVVIRSDSILDLVNDLGGLLSSLGLKVVSLCLCVLVDHDLFYGKFRKHAGLRRLSRVYLETGGMPPQDFASNHTAEMNRSGFALPV
jgi:hypothetical protein